MVEREKREDREREQRWDIEIERKETKGKRVFS